MVKYTTKAFVLATGAACLLLVLASLADLHLIAAISKLLASTGFLIVAIQSGAL